MDKLRQVLPNPKFWLKRGVNQTLLIFVLSFAMVGFLVAAKAANADDNAVVTFVLRAMCAILEAVASLVAGILMWVIHFLIQLSGYNNFLDAQVVSVGWVLTRDVANMFYILILLVIAFATMLKIDKWSIKALLPRLIGTAILVNFSKTIIGILIDLGQVVMLTFVNGYAATAGGNFVTMFNLSSVFKIAATGQPPASVSGAVFMGYLLGLVVLTVATIVTAVFAAILLFRIITLWFLVVLSPIAFLLGTIPGRGQEYYGKWWTNLINNILVGPIVAFILWLSLATMGSGGQINEITTSNALPDAVLKNATEAGNTQQIAGTATEFSKWENLGSFAVAIAMLLMGLSMIQELNVVGAGLAGSAKGMIEGAAKSLAKRAALAPVKLGAKGAGALAREVPREKGWLALSRMSGLPSFLSRAAAQRAGKVISGREKLAEGKIAAMRALPLAEQLRLAESWKPTFPTNKMAKSAMMERMLSHPDFGKGMRAAGPVKASAFMKDYEALLKEVPGGDEKKFDKIKDFRRNNIDLVEDAAERRKIITGMELKDATKISADTLKNPQVYGEILQSSPRLLNRIVRYGNEEQRKILKVNGYKYNSDLEEELEVEGGEEEEATTGGRKSKEAATGKKAAPMPSGAREIELAGGEVAPLDLETPVVPSKPPKPSPGGAPPPPPPPTPGTPPPTPGASSPTPPPTPAKSTPPPTTPPPTPPPKTPPPTPPPAGGTAPKAPTAGAPVAKSAAATRTVPAEAYRDVGYTPPANAADPDDKGSFRPGGAEELANIVRSAAAEPPAWINNLQVEAVVKKMPDGKVAGLTELGKVLGQNISTGQFLRLAQTANTKSQKDLVSALGAAKKVAGSAGTGREKKDRDAAFKGVLRDPALADIAESIDELAKGIGEAEGKV